MNHQDIKTIIRKPKKKINEKKIKRRKTPIPIITNIRVTGKLREYTNSIETGQHKPYSYRFDVRAHYRRFKNKEKYKGLYSTPLNKLHEQGYQIDPDGTILRWIPTYQKGHGIYIKKDYSLELEGD